MSVAKISQILLNSLERFHYGDNLSLIGTLLMIVQNYRFKSVG